MVVSTMLVTDACLSSIEIGRDAAAVRFAARRRRGDTSRTCWCCAGAIRVIMRCDGLCAVCGQFDQTLLHVVTRDNVNPIEMVEQ
jgi:5-methylcytosine-specific restriction endonuclease McrA